MLASKRSCFAGIFSEPIAKLSVPCLERTSTAFGLGTKAVLDRRPPTRQHGAKTTVTLVERLPNPRVGASLAVTL